MSKNNQVILLRAHWLNDQLIEAMRRFASMDNFDVYILYDNDRQDYAPFGMNEILLTSGDLADTELLYIQNNKHFGLWKNGDYALYYAMLHLPARYEYYWMIEYDVYINYSNLNDFFDCFKDVDADFIAPYLGKRSSTWMWTPHTDWIFPSVYGCLFSIVRLSAPALHHGYVSRLYHKYKFKELRLRGRNWPHCEAFVPTQLVQSGFRLRDLNDIAHQFCDNETFHVELGRAFTLGAATFAHADKKLYHPVYPRK